MVKRALLDLAAALGVVSAFGFLTLNAHAAEIFSAGNALIGGLGDEIDSGYDTFSITGLPLKLRSTSWDMARHATIAIRAEVRDRSA